MAWQKFTRTRSVERELPIVTVSKSHFYFNAVAARLFELKTNARAVYHIDEDQRRIGFEFLNEDVDHSYSVFAKAGGTGYRSTSLDIIANYLWARAVALLPDPADRRFRLRPDGRFWFAQLCPAFECRVLRSDWNQIPSDASGIYRYLDVAGKTVYIGKGNVRQRLNETGREGWQFAAIEYSLVANEAKQYEWESYWIDRFKETNNGSRPAYNLVSGHGPTSPL